MSESTVLAVPRPSAAVAPAPAAASPRLTTARGAALYIGALLGPGLLLLPGLAAAQAGPASLLAWAGLLGLSALFAVVFTALGRAFPSAGGVIGYVSAGLGARQGLAAGWSFLAGVIAGAPVVCLIGAGYLTELTGGGRVGQAVIAAALLLTVLALAAGGMRTSATAQLLMVSLLIVVVIVAVAGSAASAHAANWTPFAPHGWLAVGHAATTLMLSFVGWEAVAPLTAQFADPAQAAAPRRGHHPRGHQRALPRPRRRDDRRARHRRRVDGAAGRPAAARHRAGRHGGRGGRGDRADAGRRQRLRQRRRRHDGPSAGRSRSPPPGGSDRRRQADRRRGERPPPRPPGRLLLLAAIAGTGLPLIALYGVGLVSPVSLVAIPTTLFLTVYLGSMLAATRVLHGRPGWPRFPRRPPRRSCWPTAAGRWRFPPRSSRSSQ